MKRPFFVFAAVFAGLSLLLQFFFAALFLESSELNRFLRVKKIFENTVRLSSKTAGSYAGFASGPGCAIFTMPSVDLKLAPVSGAEDTAVFFTSRDTAVFSLFPSALSARKKENLKIRAIDMKILPVSESYQGFSCCGQRPLSRSFYRPEYAVMLPGSEKVLNP